MYELIYTSVSTSPLDKNACNNLLKKAQFNNNLDDITGMLLFDGHLFIQLIEGDKNKVLNLYEKIKNDPRHTNVVCIYSGTIASRSYGD